MGKIDKWERKGSVPLELYKKCYDAGIYAARWPSKYGGTPFGGYKWDYFMMMARIEAFCRAGSGGLMTSLFINEISVPPIMHFGTPAQKAMFEPVIQGKVIASLAISEPNAGSDVANLTCVAKRDPSDPNYYIVNGMKKWISNGVKSKYFVTAVRTGGEGLKGISLLIIENVKGVTTSRINTQGHHCSETALIIFSNVRVPVSNLIGNENEGFKLIMYNFNQERFAILCFSIFLARTAFLEAIEYSKQRKTFKKALIKHQVIRHKIAEMGRQILASYSMMEKLAYAVDQDPMGQRDSSVGANIALLKVQSTKMLEFVAREASQILGGASYVIGKKIERIYRDVRAFAIYGGSEEIMLDLACKLAFRGKAIKLNMPFVDWENHISPYYSDRHHRWRALCKKFVEKEILPKISKWEKNGDVPLDVYKKCYEYGIYGARYPKEFGGTPFENKAYDMFLMMILYEQLGRACAGGIFSSLYIQGISIPPIMHFGTQEQKFQFTECVKGECVAALAISEPNAGSDVANLSCTAVRDASNPNYYIVNGTKKWISNGTKAKYFVTAVRTGGKGLKGVSLLLIERSDAVKTARIKTEGHHCSHTTFVMIQNARVPVKNLIGKENEGFKLIMYNFNQERFGIACQALMLCRAAIVESVNYAQQRKTFGKPLLAHQVIRHKIAEMARHTMVTYCMMEKLAYQMQNDPLGIKDKSIPANICIAKVQATKTLEFVAREGVQIFGGAGYVWGKPIERIYRDVRAFAIYGGSEEIMLDVSVRLSKL